MSKDCLFISFLSPCSEESLLILEQEITQALVLSFLYKSIQSMFCTEDFKVCLETVKLNVDSLVVFLLRSSCHS